MTPMKISFSSQMTSSLSEAILLRMISVEQAVCLIRANLLDFGTEETSVKKLDSNITAQSILADRDYPPFHRVMMDGIAVMFNIYQEGKREFRVDGICPAGEPQKILSDLSSCLEVMTGVPLPQGTDLVIPYEHVKIENGVAYVIKEEIRSHMENVHLKGSDAKNGDVILASGEQFHGPHWGIAASVGAINITVKKKPKINIISTGDELVEVHAKPLEHQIRRSNAYALKASLMLFGYEEIELSHLPDDVEAIENHYLKAKDNFDMMIYSGGVSQGKFDYLPSTWKKLGVKEIFHGIAQRPGKPLWFGVHDESKTVVIGLPGNPVSGLVCLHRYFLDHNEIYAELMEKIIFKKDLTYFVPVKIQYTREGKIKALPLKMKNSGEFSALAGSDGFMELPRDQSVFNSGKSYLFHPWRPM